MRLNLFFQMPSYFFPLCATQETIAWQLEEVVSKIQFFRIVYHSIFRSGVVAAQLGLAALSLLCFQNCTEGFSRASSDVKFEINAPIEFPATPAHSSVGQTQYLIFQNFTGSNDGSGVFKQVTSDQPRMRAILVNYVAKIQSQLQPKMILQAADRKYGFAIGPLALDQSDQELRDTIITAFEVASEMKVAVALHFDITHFWRNAKNADGTLLSNSVGENDNREWKDWSGTIADKDRWDDEPNIMPSMCFECEQVKALVDRVAKTVIAPAVKAGLNRLKSTGDQDLFAGVILGWEAGSLNPIGYHSLKIKGYGPSISLTDSLADLNKVQQQILHDYLQRWSQHLVGEGISREKIYTHTSNLSQWHIDNTFLHVKQQLGTQEFSNWLLSFMGNGPDSFWNAFNDYSNAGFTVYANSAKEGQFETIWAEAKKHSGSWGMVEGTNVTLSGTSSEINWETYLGKIFNHGGSLAAIFGGFMDQNHGGYTASTEGTEAIFAYQKFLKGQKLDESN